VVGHLRVQPGWHVLEGRPLLLHLLLLHLLLLQARHKVIQPGQIWEAQLQGGSAQLGLLLLLRLLLLLLHPGCCAVPGQQREGLRVVLARLHSTWQQAVPGSGLRQQRRPQQPPP
jgi:hypothetical protein